MSKTPISTRVKIDSLLATSFHTPCYICKHNISPGDEIHWDHRVPEALGGTTDFDNIRAVHAGCHHQKTFGSKATTAGSDIHMIAKAKRIARGGKTVHKPMGKSRGFDKRLHRPLDPRKKTEVRYGR